MKTLHCQLPFTVPLTLRDRQTAWEFHQQHSEVKKAKQVYLNTLAILAVRVYLETLGIKTALDASDSWSPWMQALANSADLEIIDRGKIECRPVLPDEKIVRIPAETWEDRLGYIAVRLNAELTEAQLIGFITPFTFETEEITLEKLEPLDLLLEEIAVSRAKTLEAQKTGAIAHLSRWFDDRIEAGWETLDTLFGSQHFVFRSAFRSELTTIKRGKKLELEKTGERIALLVDVAQNRGKEMDISTTVMPIGETRSLPKDLQLILLDETGESILHAKPGSHHGDGIELQFSGEFGESFRLEIVLQDFKLIEEFTI